MGYILPLSVAWCHAFHGDTVKNLGFVEVIESLVGSLEADSKGEQVLFTTLVASFKSLVELIT